MLSRLTFLETRSAVVRVLRTYDVPMKIQVRRGLFPPTPYDSTTKHKIHFKYIYNVAWESLPIVVITALSVAGIFLKSIYAFRNKVDVVWETHSRDNISRTMDLESPSVHKMFIINQRYDPWPEMKKVQKKLQQAAHRELSRKDYCKFK